MTYRPLHMRPRRRVARPLGALAVIGATAGVSLAMAGPASAATGGDVLAKIKNCESSGSYTAHNPSSTASGAYQFLDSTWRGLPGTQGYSSAADAPASVQDKVAQYVLSTQGTTPWVASESCWGASFAVAGGTGASSSTGSTGSDTSSGQTRSSDSDGTGATSTGARHWYWQNGHLYWTTHWSGDRNDGRATTGSDHAANHAEGTIVDTRTVDGATRYYHWRHQHLYWTTHPAQHGLTR